MVTYILMIHLVTVDMHGKQASKRSYPGEAYQSEMQCRIQQPLNKSEGGGLNTSGESWTQEFVYKKECIKLEVK